MDLPAQHASCFIYQQTKQAPYLLVRKRTIPADRPQFGEVSANFLQIEGYRMVSAEVPYGW
jgi:hypothetical protein